MAPKRAFGGVLRPFGEVSGATTGRGPACSAARDGDGQGVLRWSRGGTSAFSGAGQGGAGGSAVEPGGGASVFSGAGRGRCRGFCGGARRRSQRVQRRGIGAGRGVQRCRRDGPAAGSQKKCSEGKMRPPPGRKKSVPRGRCAAARTHTGTKKTDLGPFTSISATLLCYSTGFCSGMLVRYTLPHDNGSALREPVSFAGDFRQHVLLQQPVCLRFRSARRLGVTAVKASAIRSLSRSAARRSGLSRLAAGISAVRVAPRESLRPPPGSQFSAAGVTVLSRPGSRPSAARNLPSLLLAPSAAGVTAPPRQYGRPPATGESPASSSRRASPARDSTAYRPAP